MKSIRFNWKFFEKIRTIHPYLKTYPKMHSKKKYNRKEHMWQDEDAAAEECDRRGPQRNRSERKRPEKRSRKGPVVTTTTTTTTERSVVILITQLRYRTRLRCLCVFCCTGAGPGVVKYTQCDFTVTFM